MNSVVLKHLCVLALVSLALSLVAPLVVGQERPSGESAQVAADGEHQSPLCDPAMIDATFAFSDEPAGEQTVSLYFLNKGDIACRLKDPPNPSFAVDGHSINVGSCPFCGPDGKPVPMWNQRPENQIVLAPGATAVIDVNWVSTGESCQWADWASVFFDWIELYDWRKLSDFLFIPSGWPLHICSPVRSFGYRLAADSPSTEAKKGPTLRVSLLQKTVYSDEHATLHVELANRTQSSERALGCASLYTVRRSAPLQTRLEPLPTVGGSRVDSYTPEQIREDRERAWPQWKKDFRRTCDIAGGTTNADANMAASDLATVTRIEWRTATTSGTKPVFLSVAAHFEVRDVDSLPSNWGEPTKGIRAGISVDRERFTSGERVPLHLRWENVNASDPLGQGECGDPKPDVEIQDSQHHVLKTIPTYSDCMGHGWGPFEISISKPQHIFREFNTVSDPVPPFVTPAPPMLLGPGIYFLVSVWSPRVLEKSDPVVLGRQIGAGKMGAVYATARSTPVRIEVVPGAPQ
jgi:hypothetical protein